MTGIKQQLFSSRQGPWIYYTILRYFIKMVNISSYCFSMWLCDFSIWLCDFSLLGAKRHCEISTVLSLTGTLNAGGLYKFCDFCHQIWLPYFCHHIWLLYLNERIEYKLLSLTYKVLTTAQPSYLHNLISLQTPLPPVGHIWDVMLVWRKGNINENCFCVTVLCTIIMVHKDTSSSYRSVDCIGLWSCLV